METYILKRIIQAFICLIGVTIIIFMLTHMSGDPTLLMVSPEATAEDIENVRKTMGLDRPLYVQYWKFVSNIAVGDFGYSLRWGRPNLELFLERFPNTILLATVSMVVSVIVAIPIGIISSICVGRWFDTIGKVFALLGQALPVFWSGLMMILIFSVWLKLVPTSGMGTWKHLILPACSLGWLFAAQLTRLTRSAMLDVIDTEYIKMARMLGTPEYLIIFKYALKNALIPILTLGAINFVTMLNGTIIIETVFNWPGVGRLIVDAIFSRDFPLVQTCVLIASVLFIVTNLLVDILYAYIDPRIRYV